MADTTGWRDIDFRPAPPGWRVIYLDADAPDGQQVAADPVAGWLVQEEWDNEHYDDAGKELPPERPPGDRSRRVIAAICSHTDCAVLGPVDMMLNVWKVLSPDQRDPTAQEIRAEVVRRRPAPPIPPPAG